MDGSVAVENATNKVSCDAVYATMDTQAYAVPMSLVGLDPSSTRARMGQHAMKKCEDATDRRSLRLLQSTLACGLYVLTPGPPSILEITVTYIAHL